MEENLETSSSCPLSPRGERAGVRGASRTDGGIGALP